jgi:TRAP-type mannitol/chloroaromatic compound transport system permease small subunit
MFTKPLLIGNKRRLRRIGNLLLIGAALALAPLLIGMVMMTIEEVLTGKNVGEHNSIWGVLPWLTIGTMVIFGGPTLIAFKLTLLVLVYDGIVIAVRTANSTDDGGYADEGEGEGDDGDEPRSWDEYDLKL